MVRSYVAALRLQAAQHDTALLVQRVVTPSGGAIYGGGWELPSYVCEGMGCGSGSETSVAVGAGVLALRKAGVVGAVSADLRQTHSSVGGEGVEGGRDVFFVALLGDTHTTAHSAQQDAQLACTSLGHRPGALLNRKWITKGQTHLLACKSQRSFLDGVFESSKRRERSALRSRGREDWERDGW